MRKINLFGCAALLAVLMGCSTMPDTSKAYPPVSLMADCAEPIEDYATNGAMAQTLRAYKGALKLCNNDKRALRSWAGQE